MDEEDNPYRRAVRAYEAPDQILPSTSGGSPLPRSRPKNAPPRIKLLIADLGLRYRPAAAADLEAHATAIGLLTLDVADLPPDRLDRAIAEWVRSQKWMPKASELVAICQRHQREEIEATASAASDREWQQAYCDRRNAAMRDDPKGRRDVEWRVDGPGRSSLHHIVRRPTGIEPIHPKHVEARNASLASLNAVFRYDATGRARDLTDDEEYRRIKRGGPTFGRDGWPAPQAA